MKNKLILQDGLGLSPNGTQISFTWGDIKGLRSKILYWDGIINLDSGIVQADERPGIGKLKSCGLYEDAYIKIEGPGDLNSLITIATRKKIKELLADKTINYSMSDLSEKIFIDSGDAVQTGGSLLHLMNSLPVISDTIPIDEILEFRFKRQDMHRNLINKINELEINVSDSENPGSSLKKAIHEIDVSCAELIQVYKESKFQWASGSVGINFNLNDIIKVATKTFAGSLLILTESQAAIAGMVAGAASVFTFERSYKINKIDKKNPFNYAIDVTKKFS